ncbi:FAD:protein FMN transferase [Lysinimonas soli]|uniref:FAD:protein FMN transferase n=1 Tax=Lysinimonas soli TaxID=1074233 RepID=A0ABW0NS57_9MICO
MIESRTLSAMGGPAHLTVNGGRAGLLDELAEELERLDGLWSRFLPHSELSRLNAAAGETVTVDPATVGLIQAMRDGHAETGGAYDPTMLPALVAAGYEASFRDPDRRTALADGVRDGGDLAAIEIEGTRVRLPRGMTLDSGGIGKGYAADLLCERALQRGATGVLVELDGDLVVAGEAPVTGFWTVGVEHPDDATTHVETVRLAAGGVATSGTRRRRWSVGDEERHHLLDPRTLLPARTGLHAATVIAGTGARAEVLTKAAFVPPPEGFLNWLPTRNAAGLVISTEGDIRTSSNWEDYR